MLAVGVFVLANAPIGNAQSLLEARQAFDAGDYELAEKMATKKVEDGTWNERWPRLLIQCQLLTGKYADAKKTYDDAMRRYSSSLTLRMQGIETLRMNDLADMAEDADRAFLERLRRTNMRFATRDNLLATGRYLLEKGEDAREILQKCFDRVRDSDPRYLESYIATAELALDKGDFQVAVDTLARAKQVSQTDPRIEFLLARAWAPSDPKQATGALNTALQLNPQHVPSLIYSAELAIDQENYDRAEEILEEVHDINPSNQQAWALLAVIAHVRGDYEQETELRGKALQTWSTNPEVDYLIGRKLSDKYRFEEGAAAQRRALEFDAGYRPARFQLAQDLLRLGFDDAGWDLAHGVADDDQYNVVAHNLITLHDRLKGFKVLEANGIQVRMEEREAQVYGDEVLDLLSEAKNVLCAKYDVSPNKPIVVEIFPDQKDFAIRTFGLPGGAGFLGVCFGRVITANSPASQGESPSNWRSVLWHEFCHVVTLEKTKNRMPRWLSEGISVYEERQRDSSWGESMTPTYREMLLSNQLTPVSNLSAAFLNPPTPIHLQFAYYESSLVIEFLIERYGIEALKTILDDLGDGLVMNDALQKNIGSLDKLDSQFAEYARKIATDFGAEADWTREGLPESPTFEQLTQWIEENPNNYWGLRSIAKFAIGAKDYETAKETLEKLQSLGTMTGEQGGPQEMLAQVYRELGDESAERETLESQITKSPNALQSLRRLIEIGQDSQQWEQVAVYAEKVAAVNPLLPETHMVMADAAKQLDRPQDVVDALTALSYMDPIDPAAIDFGLAEALADMSQFALAKHHVLRALDEAPRFRDAHRLLLMLSESDPDTVSPEAEDAEEAVSADAEEAVSADAEEAVSAEAEEAAGPNAVDPDADSAPSESSDAGESELGGESQSQDE